MRLPPQHTRTNFKFLHGGWIVAYLLQNGLKEDGAVRDSLWHFAMLGMSEKRGNLIFFLIKGNLEKSISKEEKKERQGGAGNWSVVLQTIKKRKSRIE